MSTDPRWITETDVTTVMDMTQAIDALQDGLLAESRGRAENMVKTHVSWGGGSTLHAIGAVFSEDGFVGTKTWSHTPGGACPLLILFDSRTGGLKAIIEAFALGQLRTASVSGLATRWLSRPDSTELAVIGTGKQALPQVAAVLAVRPIRHIRVYSPNEEHRIQFAETLRTQFDVAVTDGATCREVVSGAGVITVVTRATSPFLGSEDVSPGTHINAVGAIVPERAELKQDILRRCGTICVDSKPQARKLSRELMDFCGSDNRRWETIVPLSKIVAERRRRSDSDDLTLLKSLGMGISDLALGMEVYRRAVDRDLGRPFPHPARARLRFQTA